MFKILLIYLRSFIGIPLLLVGSPLIHERGYWCGLDAQTEHQFDFWLAQAIAKFLQQEQANHVADFGCGMGDYVRLLQAYHIDCIGLDGNPDTERLTHGLGMTLDFTQKMEIHKVFDWVISLEVGEHIPPEYETIFLENLDKHNIKGIILSWAVQGQGGYGHVNEQNNSVIKAKLAHMGYTNDLEAENQMRKEASLWWFKKSLMVFRKES